MDGFQVVNMLKIEDFKKLDIRIGKVLNAEKIEGADKLLKLEVDFGPAEQGSDSEEQKYGDEVANENFLVRSAKEDKSSNPVEEPANSHSENFISSQEVVQDKQNVKQIVSGIAQFYKPEDIIGKQFPFIINLEPRKIRGIESQGMIMVANDNGKIVLLNPDKEVENGSKID